ncbi:MAG TPA: ester cyclase [Thermoplasmata archaeon]
MSVKQNLQLIEKMWASYNARDWNSFGAMHAESAVMSEPGRKPYRGRDAILKSYQGMLTVFPDTQMKTVRAFGQDDMVCFEVIASATHKGPLMAPDGKTIPPTNKRIQVDITAVAKIRNGEIVEFHESYDRLGLMAQLG